METQNEASWWLGLASFVLLSSVVFSGMVGWAAAQRVEAADAMTLTPVAAEASYDRMASPAR